MNKLRTSLVASIALGLSVPASAQVVGGHWELEWHLNGQNQDDGFGRQVVGVGDLNQDGSDDFLVSAWFASPGGVNRAGAVTAYSGATGLPLYHWDGTDPNGFLGHSIDGAGDVNGDGVPDVIIGATGARPGGLNRAGSAYVYSGSDGTLIHRLDGQAAFDSHGFVAGAGDIDGDGYDDLLVGADGASPGGLFRAGSAFLYSGRTGLLLRQFDGTETEGHFGNSLSGAGDLDGDGTNDLLIAGIDEDPQGVANAGVVYVYSGATGLVVKEVEGTEVNGQFGIGIAGLGDIDGDGKNDFAVGAPGFASGPSRGTVDVYSGLGSTPILQLQGESVGDRFGISVADAGDVDGDGRPDLLVGAQRADPAGLVDAGAAYLYSGRSGQLLRRFDGDAPGDNFGASVASAGDIDDNGHDAVLIGAFLAQPGGLVGAGSCSIYSLAPFLYLDRESLSIAGGATAHFDLAFPASEAGKRYAILASISGTGPVTLAGLEVPLSQDSVLNMFLSRNAPAAIQNELGVLDANATAASTLTAVPSMAAVIGQEIHFCAITFDLSPLAGRRASVARAITIQP